MPACHQTGYRPPPPILPPRRPPPPQPTSRSLGCRRPGFRPSLLFHLRQPPSHQPGYRQLDCHRPGCYPHPRRRRSQRRFLRSRPRSRWSSRPHHLPRRLAETFRSALVRMLRANSRCRLQRRKRVLWSSVDDTTCTIIPAVPRRRSLAVSCELAASRLYRFCNEPRLSCKEVAPQVC